MFIRLTEAASSLADALLISDTPSSRCVSCLGTFCCRVVRATSGCCAFSLIRCGFLLTLCSFISRGSIWDILFSIFNEHMEVT